MKKVIIIAEAGVNHNGDISLAYKLVDAAKQAGADYIKFQTFNAQKLASRYSEKAEYQKQSTGGDQSQLDMLRALELKQEDFRSLQQYARSIGIDFISTPFDLDSVDFLAALDMPFWKLPSGEITNLPYLMKIAQTKKPVVMSTGMCTMQEIKDAVSVLKEYGVDDITLLHCNTQYPTCYEDVNLRAMNHIAQETGLPVGYSDHTLGIEVPVAAVAMGACVIEKHFTLDKSMPGPDHKASLDPAELTSMVASIRSIEAALGDGVKRPSPSEQANMAVARKSIVAARDIKKGECFTQENITTKRPGTGISPMKWFEILGKPAVKDFVEDEIIVL